jgi:hypothetical protein
VVKEMKDPTPIISYEPNKALLRAWMEKYSHCYELILPEDRSPKVFEIMQRDLANYFPQYKVSLEKRMRPCPGAGAHRQ